MYKLQLTPEIQSRFPEYKALILYATNLTNQPSDDTTIQLLRLTEQAVRQEFGDNKPTSHPHIAAWRETYQKFGAKPSKYPCSVEALLSRVLKDQALPAINRITDIYNKITIFFCFPFYKEAKL
jgi:DNA/RNA-binding domain of Phe-tRNA-synthetase-like protein